MTEPDEALIWARERAKADWLESSDEVGVLHTAAEDFPSGDSDHFEDVAWRAEAYRAGQAASAERIKALEGELAIWNTEFPASRLRTIKEKGEESIATKINAARLEGYMQGLRVAKLTAMAVTREYNYFRYQQFIDVIEGCEREARRAIGKEADR